VTISILDWAVNNVFGDEGNALGLPCFLDIALDEVKAFVADAALRHGRELNVLDCSVGNPEAELAVLIRSNGANNSALLLANLDKAPFRNQMGLVSTMFEDHYRKGHSTIGCTGSIAAFCSVADRSNWPYDAWIQDRMTFITSLKEVDRSQ
jgi:hypothetical protein